MAEKEEKMNTPMLTPNNLDLRKSMEVGMELVMICGACGARAAGHEQMPDAPCWHCKASEQHTVSLGRWADNKWILNSEKERGS